MYIFRSFFQSVCVLGYCLLPTTISLIVCRVILLAEHTNVLFFLRFTISMIGFIWATYGNFCCYGNYGCTCFVFSSLHDILRRQSETWKETTGGVPYRAVLFHNIVAGDIAHKHINCINN